jgi:hypothetical protein
VFDCAEKVLVMQLVLLIPFLLNLLLI